VMAARVFHPLRLLRTAVTAEWATLRRDMSALSCMNSNQTTVSTDCSAYTGMERSPYTNLRFTKNLGILVVV